jgi:hypothetical protein
MSFSDTTFQTSALDNQDLQDLSARRIRRAIRTVRQIGLSRVIASAQELGLASSVDFVLRNFRHVIADQIARRWDRQYGVDTAGSVQLSSLSIDGANRHLGNEAVCTSPKSFDFMRRSLPLDLANYVFVDVGAGKSRTLLLASRYNFAKIVGIEFAKELVECSRRNLAQFGSEWQECRELEIIEADATEFVFPNRPLVIFFYNPFGREVFDVVLRNIVSSLKANPRNCHIVYGSSSHNAIEWARPAILASGIFEEVPAKAMPLFFDAVRTIEFGVFSSTS